MAKRTKDRTTFRFKSVQLFKDQSLGIGSYGAVCKAKCDDLLCAAKIIHPTLFDPTALHQIAPQREHRLPIRRFEQECEFMSAIRHPNIVQYLGMFRDTDTHLPILLMELMDDSLTHFLESSTQPIPYHIQVNICHDVTLALSFLHSNNIVHRDLSSNNVLLIGNVNILAKVTDFGMARLGDINYNPQATRFTNTMCPGTDVYMPPEAVQDKPVYTEKIDCFSFGVIIVQILSRQFPNPGDRLQRIALNHPGLPTGSVLVEVPEVNRRQNHISQIPPKHPLIPIALNCLNNNAGERPSAHQLCERLSDLKDMPQYAEIARTAQDKDAVIRSLSMHMEENNRTKEAEIQQLRQQLKQERDQANRQLKEKERQLTHINQQLETSEQVVFQFERRIAELEYELSQIKLQNTKPGKQEKQQIIKITWREGKRTPCKMYRDCDAVVDGNTVYVRNGDTVNVYSYDATSDSWSQLPDCVNESGSLAAINGLLTTVGGYSYPSYSNELFSLTGEGSGSRWTKKFPPMPTKRKRATTINTGTVLIVAGGRGVDDRVLSTVEVMNIENIQWSTAMNLPEPLYLASATVCGDQLYMLGGIHKGFYYTESVYICSVTDLVQTCILNTSSTLKTKLKRRSLECKTSTWKRVANFPNACSTCESFHGRLLAIGGSMESGKPTTAVHMYDSATDSWEIISHMTIGRYRCFAAVLPDNRLMVMGGIITEGSSIDTTEFMSMCN